MPTPVSFPVPQGPWGFDPNSGAPVQQYFPDATFFSFGPYPSTGTVANSIDGVLNQGYVGMIFDDTGSLWPDCQLGAANTAMGIRNVYDTWA